MPLELHLARLDRYVQELAQLERGRWPRRLRRPDQPGNSTKSVPMGCPFSSLSITKGT